MEETISLTEILGVLKKKIGLIIAMTFVGLGLAGGITFFGITPKYSSQAQLIVTLPSSANGGNTTTNDVNTNILMINTYRELIVGDATIERVQQQLYSEYDIDMTTDEIRKSLSVEAPTNALLFSIVATTVSPNKSEKIANVTATVFQSTAKEVLNESVDKISIISKATPNLKQVSPNNKLNLAIGLAVGMLVGIGLAFLFELFDKTIKEDSFVTDTLEYTVIGTIPHMTDKDLNVSKNKNVLTVNNEPKKKPRETPEEPNVSRRNRTKV